MGMVMSFMGGGFMAGGMLSSRLLHMISGTLYDKVIAQTIESEDQFHIAVLDIFSTLNSALPGKHYDVPPRAEVTEVFEDWKNESDPGKRKSLFVDFMKTKVNVNKMDMPTVIAGVVTPPAAMAAKRAGEKVPQLKMIKAIPDVLFVPSATVLALFSVKVGTRVIKSMASSPCTT